MKAHNKLSQILVYLFFSRKDCLFTLMCKVILKFLQTSVVDTKPFVVLLFKDVELSNFEDCKNLHKDLMEYAKQYKRKVIQQKKVSTSTDYWRSFGMQN